MEKTTNLYHNLGYWFLSLIVLVGAAFYTTYFTVLFQPMPRLIHIHFTLMMIWIAMLITQPFLIKYKKRALHRFIGKISYIVVPLVLLFSYLVMRGGYHRGLTAMQQQVATNGLSADEMLRIAGDQPIAFYYLLMFAVFYSLAIINRHSSSKHARYMLATSLTLLGPTVDRIIFIYFKIEKIGFIPVFAIAFLIADLILILLLIKDYKSNKPLNTLITCLVIYITAQTLYFVVPSFGWWASFMHFIMGPAS